MKSWSRRLLFTALGLMIPATAPATVVIEVGLEEMTHASTVVFHGIVEQVVVRQHPDRKGALTTEITFQSLEMIKGTAHFRDGHLKLSLLGGTLGDYTLHVPGMPTFVQGQECVIFLEETTAGFALTGLHQGVFVVETVPGGVERVVSQQPSGASMARFNDKGRFVLGQPAPLTRHHPLNAFLEEVRHYVDEKRAAPLAP